jgi:hypothetical protein
MSKLSDLLDEHAAEAVREALEKLLSHVDTAVSREIERDHGAPASAYSTGRMNGMDYARIVVQAYVEKFRVED